MPDRVGDSDPGYENPFQRDRRLGEASGAGTQVGTGDFFSDFFDPNPITYVDRQLRGKEIPGGVDGNFRLQQMLQGRIDSAAPGRSNPYDTAFGNQSREAQTAALDRLMNGTSSVGAQAGQAMGQLGRQIASATGSSGGLEQALAAGAGAEGGLGIASQAGGARLAEFMKQQEMAGRGYGEQRKQDTRQMDSHNKSGLTATEQDDKLRNFYADQAAELSAADQDLFAKNAELRTKLLTAKDQQNWNAVATTAEVAANVIKMIVGGA